MRTVPIARTAAGIGAKRRTAMIECRFELPLAVVSATIRDRREELG